MQNLLFIDGRFVPAVGRGEIEVLNPADGSPITRIAAAEAAASRRSGTKGMRMGFRSRSARTLPSFPGSVHPRSRAHCRRPDGERSGTRPEEIVRVPRTLSLPLRLLLRGRGAV
ncbi:hypothetical protein G039_0315990 [Pseudomonas aeruginosa VRFPA01]|nr:hypothetical protein G039_0315990 [Pseudomonas aeruginosa VRFPA01]